MARMSAAQAVYMELVGAKKDADCKKVAVPKGVSKERGCCNEYKPDSRGATEFRCGVCEYVTERGARQF